MEMQDVDYELVCEPGIYAANPLKRETENI